MLVLVRKAGQRLFIGESIVVTVVEIRGDGKVRLGIEAPRDVPIVREEAIQKFPKQERTDD